MTDPFAGLRPWQPNHVKNLLRALLTHRAALDASDTGVGKTYAALAVARIFECAPLVLGPKATRSGWEDAAGQMKVPIQFINYEQARIDTVPHECPKCGKRKARSPKDLVHFGPPTCGCQDWTLGPVGPFLEHPMKPEYVDRLGYEKPHGLGSFWVWTVKPTMLVFDECHLCGGSTSLTGKLLRSANQAAQYTLCLSATAADNPEHLKNLGRTLGLFDSRSYMPWLMRHGLKPDYTGGWAMTEDSVELHAAMKKVHTEIFPSRGARLRRLDIPGFPKTIIDTLLIEPDEDVKESAKLIVMDDLASRVRGRKVLEMEIVRLLPDYILQSHANGNNVGVFLNFTEAINALAKWATKKKLSFGIIDGRQSGEKGDAERRKILEGIRGGSLNLLIVQNMAGGAGLSAHHATKPADVYIVPSENGRQMKQVCGRFWRDGGAFSRQFFVGLRETPQQDILESNQEKIRRIDTLNGDDLDSIKFL